MSHRDLELNSLSRYSKDSPRLIREEYGHCEVPAGCGGVVLRWRNPDAGLPVLVKLYAAGECRVYLDGVALTASRPLIPFGEHLLALEISGVDPRYLILLFSAEYRESERDGILRSRPTGEQVTVRSAADGTWKFTDATPPDVSWRGLDYDDSGWGVMVQNSERPAVADPKAVDPDHWRIHWLLKQGAIGLGIPTTAPGFWQRLRSPSHPGGTGPDGLSGPRDLWVRKRFTISHVSEGQEG